MEVIDIPPAVSAFSLGVKGGNVATLASSFDGLHVSPKSTSFLQLPVGAHPASGHRANSIRRMAFDLKRGVQGLDRGPSFEISFSSGCRAT